MYEGRLQGLEASMASLQRFLVICISQMSSRQLQDTLCTGKDGRILERLLQMEFYRVCYAVLPKQHRADPDVHQVRQLQVVLY